MLNRKNALALAAALTVLLLAGCGSSGGLGDIYGGGSPTSPVSNEIRGTVDQVDLNSRSIYLTNVSGYTSMLSSGGGSSVRVYYDDRTSVDYQGRTYRPEDLERGDQVAVRVDQSGNRLLANSMTVLYNASGSTTGTSTSTLRGTVRSVDSTSRTIQIDRSGYGQTTTVEYDPNTYVQFNGRSYRPEDLERGDEIDIRVRDLGNGRVIAEDINVLRSVSGGTPGPTSTQSTIRGTVRYIDTARRTIELEQANWISGFNTGAGTTFTVQYDTNTRVDYQGQLYPVTNLERGDVIEVQVQNLGGANYVAQRIYLVRDVNMR